LSRRPRLLPPGNERVSCNWAWNYFENVAIVRHGWRKPETPPAPRRGSANAALEANNGTARMSQAVTYLDLNVTLADHVAIVEIRRPPNNFFDAALIGAIADAFEDLDRQPDCRAIVLGAQGKAFCAGMDFSKAGGEGGGGTEQRPHPHLYKQAARLFRTQKPCVAAVHGAAIGGGLGLALVADFRVTCAEARFAANFNRLGFHPGFGLSVTLPRLIGPQRATMLFYTGRRISGQEAVTIGLADLLVAQAEVRTAALALAQEIAQSAPLAVVSTRATLRRGLAEMVEAATEREFVEQAWQRKTADFREGIEASARRRLPRFQGR
jgi:enoyl-CoA hydratase/carnithine racemase